MNPLQIDPIVFHCDSNMQTIGDMIAFCFQWELILDEVVHLELPAVTPIDEAKKHIIERNIACFLQTNNCPTIQTLGDLIASLPLYEEIATNFINLELPATTPITEANKFMIANGIPCPQLCSF